MKLLRARSERLVEVRFAREVAAWVAVRDVRSQHHKLDQFWHITLRWLWNTCHANDTHVFLLLLMPFCLRLNVHTFCNWGHIFRDHSQHGLQRQSSGTLPAATQVQVVRESLNHLYKFQGFWSRLLNVSSMQKKQPLSLNHTRVHPFHCAMFHKAAAWIECKRRQMCMSLVSTQWSNSTGLGLRFKGQPKHYIQARDMNALLTKPLHQQRWDLRYTVCTANAPCAHVNAPCSISADIIKVSLCKYSWCVCRLLSVMVLLMQRLCCIAVP